MDTLYTFGDNITHYKAESVYFLGLMNSAAKLIPRLPDPKPERRELLGLACRCQGGPGPIQPRLFSSRFRAVGFRV